MNRSRSWSIVRFDSRDGERLKVSYRGLVTSKAEAEAKLRDEYGAYNFDWSEGYDSGDWDDDLSTRQLDARRARRYYR